MVRPPYKPGSRFRVRTWRGIDIAGVHWKQGEEIPTDELMPAALYAMYRLFEVDVIEEESGEDPDERMPGDPEEEKDVSSTSESRQQRRGRRAA